MLQIDGALHEIAVRSRWLSECIDQDPYDQELSFPSDRGSSLVSRWEELLAREDPSAFERRLAWDGLDKEAVRAALDQAPAATETLPAWSKTLRDIVRLYEFLPIADGDPDRAVDAEDPVPFEEIILPFIALARYRLLGDSGQHASVSDSALAELERALLYQIAELFRLPTYRYFKLHRALDGKDFSKFQPETQTEFGKDNLYYRHFVKMMRSREILAFFLDFPCLARLAVEATENWIESARELLERLDEDRDEIECKFADGSRLGKVTAISAGLSDAHNNGRSVAALTFETGLKVVYKPRELAMDRAYFSLLEWINKRGNPLQFQSLVLLDRADYGWVEYVNNNGCSDESEVANYYFRAGMILCIVFALGGTDFHFENIIANGEQPVLIDLETILHPQLEVPVEIVRMGGAPYLAQVRVQEGVLGTGLLPWWVTNDDGSTIDISGLAAVDDQAGIDRIARWSHENTDHMDLRYEFGLISKSENVVTLNDQVIQPSDYADSIIRGFQKMHEIFVDNKDEILSKAGPLSNFHSCNVRFLLRDTRIYSILLSSTLSCDSLQDGARRSIELDLLSKPLLWAKEPSRHWALRRAEQAALERNDIPYFSTPASDNRLVLENGDVLEDCFEASPLDRARARIASLNSGDLNALSQLIRASLTARVAINGSDVADAEDEMEQGAPPDAGDFFGYATTIAELLREQAIFSPAGDASWIGLGFLPVSERFQLQATGPDLYSGYTGIALFLAAYDKVSGDRAYGLMAKQALRVLQRELRDNDLIADFMSSAGLGGATGSSSVVYALLKVGELLDDSTFFVDAANLARRISAQHIADDQAFDIVSGAAGTVLSFLALFEATKEPWALDNAIACGQHLLKNRIETPSGHRTWRNRSVEKPLSGFSHGAAGIAYALLRLAAVTNDNAYREAAIESIGYEQSLFSLTSGNWRDLRTARNPFSPNSDQFCTAWCHGAPGIALARIGGLDVLDSPQIRNDIVVGLRTTQQFGIGGLDHLCCGSMGRVEVLLEASLRLNMPDLSDAARRHAGLVAARADRTGGYHTQSGHGFTDPGFFSGLGGIGYTFLRLAFPKTLPSILMWA